LTSLQDFASVLTAKNLARPKPQPNRSDSRKGAKGAKKKQIPTFAFLASLRLCSGQAWRENIPKRLTEPVLTAGQFAQTEKTLKHSNA
jgi:hypothetical protein